MVSCNILTDQLQNVLHTQTWTAVPGYADQSDADSQRNRMAKVEDINIQEEGEQDGSVVVGVDEQQVI